MKNTITCYRQTRTTLKNLVDAIARDRKTIAINGLPALLEVKPDFLPGKNNRQQIKTSQW